MRGRVQQPSAAVRNHPHGLPEGVLLLQGELPAGAHRHADALLRPRRDAAHRRRQQLHGY